jgi:hypothetical protein
LWAGEQSIFVANARFARDEFACGGTAAIVAESPTVSRQEENKDKENLLVWPARAAEADKVEADRHADPDAEGRAHARGNAVVPAAPAKDALIGNI